jgi:hypothetical protein
MMNRITNRLIKGAAIAAVTGAIAMCGAGVASAATPNATTAVTHPTTSRGVSANKGATQGFNLSNFSAETLDFVKVTGKLPAPPTAPILPGQKVNFELPDPVFGIDTGTVYYNVMGPDGTQVAKFQVGFSDDNTNGDGFWGADVTNMQGGQDTSYVVPDSTQGTNVHFEDATSSPTATQNLTAGSADEQSVIKSVCTANSGACNFSSVTQTEGWSQSKLIAEGYNGQTVEDTLTAGKSYIDQTTDTWGATVTAQGELGPITSSVEASYEHAVTTGTQLDVSDAAAILPGYTTYIWGSVYQYADTGTFVAHLGNTTWTMPGVTIYSADDTVANPLTYSTSQTAGDVILPPDSILGVSNS